MAKSTNDFNNFYNEFKHQKDLVNLKREKRKAEYELFQNQKNKFYELIAVISGYLGWLFSDKFEIDITLAFVVIVLILAIIACLFFSQKASEKAGEYKAKILAIEQVIEELEQSSKGTK